MHRRPTISKISLRGLLLTVLLACAGLTHAQDIRIGVLDFKAVTERSSAIRAMISDAEAPLAEQKRQIEEKSMNYRDQVQRLETRRSVLTDEQVQSEERAIAELREEIQDLQYEVNKQYEKLDQEVMQPAVDRIMEIVQQVATEENYDLVLPSEMALFHSEKVDLTPLVIQRLDREGVRGAGAPANPAPQIPREDTASE